MSKKKLTKEEKKALKEQKKAQGKTLGQEFKKFITRGNVLDRSVGVIMGGAFNAIVTALTNILLSVCTWAVPGGIKGLVTVLPAVNEAQAGLDPTINLGQKFAAGDLQSLAKAYAEANYGADVVANNPTLIDNAKTFIAGKYTLHGTIYTYNRSATIDWGSFINAVITFLCIALTLFVIIKVFTSVHEKRLAFEAKLKAQKEEREAKKAAEAEKNGKSSD